MNAEIGRILPITKLTTPVAPLRITIRPDQSLWLEEGGGAPTRVSRDELITRIRDRQSRILLICDSRSLARDQLLVDPLGNLILRYPADPDIKRMANDLDRLLRASRIG